MADSLASTAQPDANSEESLLLDQLQRMDRTQGQCFAVHLHMSRLQPARRDQRYIRIAARSFDTLVGNFDVTLYRLGNADLVLVCKDVRVDDVDAAVLKLRALFGEDPAAAGEMGSPDDRLTSWYDLSQTPDFNGVVEAVREVERTRPRRVARGPVKPPVGPSGLATIEAKIQKLRINDLIRNQPAVDVFDFGKQRLFFREHYVAMGDLARIVAPNHDLMANQWLFQYLTERLDRRVLAVLGRSNFNELKEAMSLNLNISTLQSPEFQVFQGQVGRHADRIIVEVQMVDILANIAVFQDLRENLQGRGIRVLIDGLTPLTLGYVDPDILKPDLIKIAWNPGYAESLGSPQMAELKESIAYTGSAKFVLGRVESEIAIAWGLKMGLRRFQGFFVDRLVEAMIAKGLL